MKRILFALLFLYPALIEGQIITTFAGTGVAGYSGDGGAATSAKFDQPIWVKMDRSGNLFVSDYGNHVIRKITPSGTISTFAGNGTGGFAGDSGPATAACLKNPGGVAFDNNGNVFISDWGNNRIRKVDITGMITTIAGSGTAGGYSGDGGSATNAKLNLPTNIVFDTSGNLYIADHTNNVVRVVNTSGIISTIAGVGSIGYTGDGGPASAAKFYFPFNLCFDLAGNLYVNDMGNAVIRKIDVSGIVTTVAGNGVHGYTGDGIQATASGLWAPTTLVLDKSGNMFIADADNYRIRKVNTAGIISTVAGIGTTGFTGDGGPATAAQLGYPQGLTIDTCDNIYIADGSFRKIRKVTFNTSCGGDVVTGVEAVVHSDAYLFPNPASLELTITAAYNMTSIVISNAVGQTIISNICNSKEVEVDIADLPVGVYLVRINNIELKKFVKQ